jgi:hypothetical protein
MWRYYNLLRQRENLPVIPIALIFCLEDEPLALATYEDTALGRSILTFRFLQISLPGLEASEYVRADNLLTVALASTMRLPAERSAQVALHVTVLRRVYQGDWPGRSTRHGPSCSSIW